MHPINENHFSTTTAEKCLSFLYLLICAEHCILRIWLGCVCLYLIPQKSHKKAEFVGSLIILLYWEFSENEFTIIVSKLNWRNGDIARSCGRRYLLFWIDHCIPYFDSLNRLSMKVHVRFGSNRYSITGGCNRGRTNRSEQRTEDRGSATAVDRINNLIGTSRVGDRNEKFFVKL